MPPVLWFQVNRPLIGLKFQQGDSYCHESKGRKRPSRLSHPERQRPWNHFPLDCVRADPALNNRGARCHKCECRDRRRRSARR